MNVFILYRNASDRHQLKPLLDRAKCEHGTTLPKRLERNTTIIQWGLRANHIEQDRVVNGQFGEALAAEQELLDKRGSEIAKHDVTYHRDILAAEHTVYEWMNPNEALSKLANPHVVKRMLTCHGLTWLIRNRSQVSASPNYRLFVFNLQPIALFKGVAPLDIDWGQRSQRQLIREAMRAIYVLGLDFAEVKLQFFKNKWAIVGINPTPYISAYTGKAWAEAIDAIKAEPVLSVRQKTNQLWLGSDSEFILRNVNDGKVVMADRYFSKKGTVGYDGLRLSGSLIIFPFVELRPQPVNGEQAAERAVQSVRQTMMRAAHKIGDLPFEWLAGGMVVKGIGTGGHLHFSGLRLRATILRLLDNYLALPMMMVESESDQERRPKFGYVGDFRLKQHGGFEYRTLPSWLVSMRISYAVFALAHFLLIHGDQLVQRPLSEPELLEAFYRGEKIKLLPSVQSIWEELQALPAFSPYARAVKPLLNASLQMKSWPVDRDFRQSWRVKMSRAKRIDSPKHPML